MNNIWSVIHLALVVAIGGGIGIWLRKLQPGPEPMDLSWSITIGVLGALVVALFGVWTSMYPIGGVLYYTSSPVGALIALLVYNIVITKE